MQGTNAGKRRKDPVFRISFQLDPSLHRRFREIAAADHRNVSQEIRRLMEQRVAEAEAPEAKAEAA